jgi:Skp family chaperone for outer membrane proteins
MKIPKFLSTGAILLVVALIFVRSANSESKVAPVAVVDVQHIIDQSTVGQRARQEVESRALQHKAELQQKKKELDSFRGQVSKQRELISAEAFQEKQGDLLRRERDFQRTVKDKQEELVRINQERIKAVVNKIDIVIKNYAQSENLKFIFEREPGFLVYHNNSLDITDAIIALVDKTYGS